MLRYFPGEILLGRSAPIGTVKDGARPEAVFHAAALLTSPNLLVLEQERTASRYAVALTGGAAILEFDAESLAGPSMLVRTSILLKEEASDLLDKLEAKLASFYPVPATNAEAEGADDLPF
jgi:hypothetical protein